MSSEAIAGLGNGMMKGLETFRRYEREDADADMKKGMYGLTMKKGEQDYNQNEQLFPEQLQQAQTNNENSKLALDFTKNTMPAKEREVARIDAAGERKERVDKYVFDAKQALQDAHNGNINAINQFAISQYEQHPDLPPPVLIYPGSQPNVVRRQSVADEDGKSAFEESTETALKRFASNIDPDFVYKNILKEKEKDKVINNQLVDPDTYKVKGDYRNDKDKGLKRGGGGEYGYGSLKPAAFNSLDSRNTRFFGKLDKFGQMILSGDAKYQKDEANKRTMELMDMNVPAWKAEILARKSVGGMRDGNSIEVQNASIEAAQDAGINPNDNGYDSFINAYKTENDSSGMKEADAEYQRLVSGRQGVGLSNNPPQQMQQQNPIVMKMPNGGSVSMSDIQATAQKYNITPEEVMAKLEANGGKR